MDKNNLPQHVALIMDGNRRWAKKQGFAIFKGHTFGQDRIEPIIDRSIELKIPYLTFWAFSTENWRRDRKEVEFLLNLFRNNLDKTVDSFHQKNVKLKIIGNLREFPKDIYEKTLYWVEKTKNNKKITVNIALNYGGRDEIIRAIKKIRNSKFEIRNLTTQNFGQFLDTAGQPEPELLIRAGGDIRLSGFMIWQMEYTEFYFTPTLWPDFTVSEFDKAIEEYQRRKRNFGK
ncbi:di-trans,poly-cis-decaprenylcistransferase [Candidatus Gottesmanbacteria bacterium]|nr:di-trans,poly-cis-decaprenylcistransferase [Candidatus Gottesmanbacteria bacterium]